jgi:uncharacterized protein YqcC (DUF446 family)
MESTQLYARASGLAAKIEAEMKAIGCWSEQALPEAAYDFLLTFARDTMSFTQWLQYVLIPRVRQIVADQGDFPARCMVGVQAIREFNGDARASDLTTLLIEFDALFDEPG